MLVLLDIPSMGGVAGIARHLSSTVSYIAAALPLDRTQFAVTVVDASPALLDLAALEPHALNPVGDWATNVLADLANTLAAWNRVTPSDQQYDQIAFATGAGRVQLICGQGTLGEGNKATSFIAGAYPTTFAHELAHNLGLGDTYCGKGCSDWFYSATTCYALQVNCRRPDATPSGNVVEDGAVRLVPVYAP